MARRIMFSLTFLLYKTAGRLTKCCFMTAGQMNVTDNRIQLCRMHQIVPFSCQERRAKNRVTTALCWPPARPFFVSVETSQFTPCCEMCRQRTWVLQTCISGKSCLFHVLEFHKEQAFVPLRAGCNLCTFTVTVVQTQVLHVWTISVPPLPLFLWY